MQQNRLAAMDAAFQLSALLGEWEHAIRNEKDKRWAEKVFLQILTDGPWLGTHGARRSDD